MIQTIIWKGRIISWIEEAKTTLVKFMYMFGAQISANHDKRQIKNNQGIDFSPVN